MINNWELFVERLGASKHTPPDVDVLSQHLKFEDEIFPSFKTIQSYFMNEYSRKTVLMTRSKWHKMDKYVLIWVMLKQLQLSGGCITNVREADFKAVSQVLGISTEKLQIKWISLMKTKLKESPWSTQEDNLILDLKRKYGAESCWTDLTLEFNKLNRVAVMRYAKQIRERWNNYLNPTINRSAWSASEKLTLMEQVDQGCTQWSKISKLLPGRTDNQVKNQYHILVKYYSRKQNNQNKEESEIVKISVEDLRSQVPQTSQSKESDKTETPLPMEPPKPVKKVCTEKIIDDRGEKKEHVEICPKLEEPQVVKDMVAKALVESHPAYGSSFLPPLNNQLGQFSTQQSFMNPNPYMMFNPYQQLLPQQFMLPFPSPMFYGQQYLNRFYY